VKWPQASLGDLCLFGPQYGANAPAIERSGNRSRYVRITDITANGRLLSKGEVEADLADETEFKLHEGDLLFARSGNTVGKTYCYDPEDGPCVFAGYLIRFRLNEELMHRRFAFYFTQSVPYQNWLLTKRRVAGQPNVNGKEYASLKVPLPSLSEQRRIVALLEQADALRRRRADADSLAERVLPALFRKMFGDPERNLQGRPTEQFERTCEDVTAGQQKTQRKDYLAEGAHPIVDQGQEFVAGYTNDSSALYSGELPVIAFGDHTRLFKFVDFPFGIGADGVRLFHPTPAFLPHFFFWQVSLLNIPSAGYSRHYKYLRRKRLIRPPLEQQTAFDKSAVHCNNLVAEFESAATNIETLFQTLLHRAFTGELTAGWREAHMKELLAEMEIQARHLASAQA